MKDVLNKASISWEQQQDHWQIICTGDWTLNQLNKVIHQFEKLNKKIPKATSVNIDIQAVEKLDSSGAVLLLRQAYRLDKNLEAVKFIGANEQQEKMLNIYRKQLDFSTSSNVTKSKSVADRLESLGRLSIKQFHSSVDFLAFIGEIFYALNYSLSHPSSIRYKAIIRNIEEAGVRALPIVALTAFLIGVVIAYQSAVQLEKFGASIFIVDMIAISVTRELAPLITAIVVAGRSGSSYTAQIGVMKITEEIDAMKTMGFNPFRFLVLPRVIALMIALPLMIFFADLIGIYGGMVIAKAQLNMSHAEFINRLQSVLDAKHVWVGLIKGPFFAALIATVGCYRGFQVSYNTESIGRYTTISVVNAIFLVIACDAVFSVILTELGI